MAEKKEKEDRAPTWKNGSHPKHRDFKKAPAPMHKSKGDEKRCGRNLQDPAARLGEFWKR